MRKTGQQPKENTGKHLGKPPWMRKCPGISRRSLSRVISVFLVSLSLFLAVALFVSAVPSDPSPPSNLTRLEDERFDSSNYLSTPVSAEAGNVTRLDITGISQTQTWQGYYGNISGVITLDDAQNNTFYDWNVPEPQGEIYASNSSIVTWANIRCVNYTPGNTSTINLSVLEANFGLQPNDVDGFDETFNASGLLNGGTPHPTFYVGTYTISEGTCPATDTYESDTATGDNFVEVLLTDNESIIFTTIIEDDTNNSVTDIVGFDGETHDFQMLVADDGHDGDDSVTTYYFFVEIN